ncbi:hypothetical protein [Kribbella koreensis]
MQVPVRSAKTAYLPRELVIGAIKAAPPCGTSRTVSSSGQPSC